MARHDKQNTQGTVIINGLQYALKKSQKGYTNFIDFKVPPMDLDDSSRKYIHIPVEADEFTIRERKIDQRLIVTRKRSGTPVKVVMEPVHIEDEQQEAVIKMYLHSIKNEYQQQERSRRCKYKSEITGQWITCFNISCKSKECPIERGLQTMLGFDESFEEVAETLGEPLDDTVSEEQQVDRLIIEEFKNYLGEIDPKLKTIVEMKMSGYTYNEIMDALGKKRDRGSYLNYQWKRIRKIAKKFHLEELLS